MGKTAYEDHIGKLSICGITVTMDHPFESGQESGRMLGTSSRPVIIQNDRRETICSAQIDPHVRTAFCPFSRFLQYLAWNFIHMKYFPFQKQLVQAFVDRIEVFQGTGIIPVGLGLTRYRGSFLKPVLFLTVERKFQAGFLIHDTGNHGC